MRAQGHSRSSLFLIELIIAIGFFSLGAAVCAQAFAKAHALTVQAQDLSFASTACSSAASVTRYTGGSLNGMREYFPTAFADSGDIAVCYDGDLAPCGPEDAAYTLRVSPGGNDGADNVRSAHIRMDAAGGDTIYALDLRWPAGEEAPHG